MGSPREELHKAALDQLPNISIDDQKRQAADIRANSGQPVERARPLIVAMRAAEDPDVRIGPGIWHLDAPNMIVASAMP
jgi:hypothetical protein